MNKIKRFTAAAAFSLLILGLPAVASAQWRDRDDDDYGRNDRYGNGRYGNYGNGDMRSIVRGLKQNARELQRHLDRDLDRSRYDGSRREDQLNDLARRFRNEVNGLSESNDSYNRRRDNRIDRVLNLGSQLDRALSRARLDHHIEQTWSNIERDLNDLERYSRSDRYGNGRNGGYGNGGYGNGRTTTNRNGLPSWWPF